METNELGECRDPGDIELNVSAVDDVIFQQVSNNQNDDPTANDQVCHTL